ncbi:hypothetical protein [Streptomyces sp. 8ZJF_21]|uniref:hypothetical protein n=1 Tax=Streptomyces sp. 8ZJF_21 TaxID=2903141 RepID=UPI001E620A41|nr:hypothetical protein [Streptomyces sp. 8ZJF_21]MCD9592326.1 hypothetical protein [Streptomyces sp. 8ZJF_21]
MDAGIAAVCGALAGGVATIGAALATGWSQREGARIAARAQYINEVRQPRREAYRGLISSATELSTAAASEAIALESERMNQALSLGEPIEKSWLDISLLGPKRALVRASQVRRDAYATLVALHRFHMWLENGQGGASDEQRGEELSQSLTDAAVRLDKSIEDFAAAAQISLEETGSEKKGR